MMDIEKLIENLENEVDSAWQLPMSGGKVLLDANEVRKTLDNIKESLPSEIVQAKKIVKDRFEILERAKNEAQNMLKVSEEKIREMVERNEIVKQAQIKAENIMKEANSKADMLKKTSEEYASNIVKNLDEIVSGYLEEIKGLRSRFKTENKN